MCDNYNYELKNYYNNQHRNIMLLEKKEIGKKRQ